MEELKELTNDDTSCRHYLTIVEWNEIIEYLRKELGRRKYIDYIVGDETVVIRLFGINMSVIKKIRIADDGEGKAQFMKRVDAALAASALSMGRYWGEMKGER